MINSDNDLLISTVKKLGLSDEEATVLAGNKAKKILSKEMKTEETSTSPQKQIKTDDSNDEKGKNQKSEKDNSLKQQSLGFF